MPLPRVSDYWIGRIHRHAANGLKAPTIFKVLEAEEWPPRDPPPSKRSVDRYLDEWKELPDNERWQMGSFAWPTTMLKGALDWEASQAALDLVRFRDATAAESPTIREVKWFWRIRQAAPAAPEAHADLLARTLAADEFARVAGLKSRASASIPDLGLYLARRDWEDPATSALLWTDIHPDPQDGDKLQVFLGAIHGKKRGRAEAEQARSARTAPELPNVMTPPNYRQPGGPTAAQQEQIAADIKSGARDVQTELREMEEEYAAELRRRQTDQD